MNPYTFLADFLVKHVSSEALLEFRVSEEVHDYFYSLLDKEKSGTATPEELRYVEEMMTVEHIVRLTKAKARKQHVHE
jgi:hypothetical protein